jgi:hypothetical protein
MPTEGPPQEPLLGSSSTPIAPESTDIGSVPKRRFRYAPAERRQLLWTAILCVAIVSALTVIIVGVNWQVYHRSEHLTLGGTASSVYRENLSFPWESQVTIQVSAPNGWVYGFFGDPQGIGYEGSDGACETLQSNGSSSCTLNYAGGGFVVYLQDMGCGVGSPCGPTPVLLTFSYGAL